MDSFKLKLRRIIWNLRKARVDSVKLKFRRIFWNLGDVRVGSSKTQIQNNILESR